MFLDQFDAILKELQNLKLHISVELANHQKVTARLAEEIVDLKTELRHKNTHYTGETLKLPEFPLTSVEALQEFDESLNSDDQIMAQFVSKTTSVKLDLLLNVFTF